MNIIERIEQVSNALISAEYELSNMTKAEDSDDRLREEAARAATIISASARELNKYRSALHPVQFGGEENSVTDDLVAVRDEIGVALHKLAENEPVEAAQILHDICKHICGY